MKKLLSTTFSTGMMILVFGFAATASSYGQCGGGWGNGNGNGNGNNNGNGNWNGGGWHHGGGGSGSGSGWGHGSGSGSGSGHGSGSGSGSGSGWHGSHGSNGSGAQYNPAAFGGYQLGGYIPNSLLNRILQSAYTFLTNPPGPIQMTIADFRNAYRNGTANFTISFVDYSNGQLRFQVQKAGGGGLLVVTLESF